MLQGQLSILDMILIDCYDKFTVNSYNTYIQEELHINFAEMHQVRLVHELHMTYPRLIDITSLQANEADKTAVVREGGGKDFNRRCK